MTGLVPGKKAGKKFDLNKYIGAVTVIIVLVVLVLGYMLLVRPELKRKSELEKQLDGVKLELQETGEYMADLKSSIRLHNAVSVSNRQFIDEFLPGGLNLSSLLPNLGFIAKKNGMELLSLNYSKLGKSKVKKRAENSAEDSDSRGSLVPVEIGLSLEGSGYNRFKNFIHDLETNSRLIEIVSFSFNPTVTQYALVLRTYYYDY